MLKSRKQMADGNETGIILLPYSSGALYRYPIKNTRDKRTTSKEKLPPAYLTILELFCLNPRSPMQIQINNNEVIGDIRPINTFPNLSGFLTKAFSISWVKLKK
jgi:hypothetical protein